MKTTPTVLRLLALATAFSSWFTAAAADLPPSGTNTISGRVRFTNVDPGILDRLGLPGDEGITAFSIFANSAEPDSLSASKYIRTDDRLGASFAMTVTANDTPLTYGLYADISLDGIADEYWTAVQQATPVTSNSPPAEVNFDECVAMLDIRFQRADGTPVAATSSRALVTETATGMWRARYLSSPAGASGSFLAVPSAIELLVSIEVDTGADLYLDRLTYLDTRVVTLACDETSPLVITIPDASDLGRIVGMANLVGEIEFPADGYLELLSRPVVKASGPANNKRYFALPGEFPDPDSDRPFALEGLVPSEPTQPWNVWVEMQFGPGYRFEYFRSPGLGEGVFNPGASVSAGAATDLANTFVMNPARLSGKITLTGPPELPGSPSALRGVTRSGDNDKNGDGIPDDSIGVYGNYGSYVNVMGVDELVPGAKLSAAGGQASVSFAGGFNPATAAVEGDYTAVVGNLDDQPGVWKLEGINLNLYSPGAPGEPYVDQSIYIQEAQPWQGPLAAGASASSDLRYGFAEVCLRIRSPLQFYYPRVVSSVGGITNIDSQGNFRSYSAYLYNASAPPYNADTATNEAVITMYLPEGTYTLLPSVSAIDPDSGVSEIRLPSLQITVVAGERLCIEDCIRLTIEPPMCTPHFGFLARANAESCDGTLTNLSLRASPLSDPSIRLGYSDIRILIGSRANLTTAHGLFPEFDGFPRALYQDILYTATALDNQGRVATRQFVAHYDLDAPVIECPADITVTSPDGAGVPVEFNVTATDNRPEPILLTIDPPSGTIFPVGATLVTCTASDLCYNTNTCSFQVIVRGPNESCALAIALTQVSPPMVSLTWDCSGALQSAPALEGPWANVADAVSPHTTAAEGTQQFFRVCATGQCGEAGATKAGLHSAITDRPVIHSGSGRAFGLDEIKAD
ncbi:MAG: HYR domain-containing protein [Verrucomicrobia bacterium]|nr:HYR domain-containing protein [Verrucomicrobiota bacterium]